VAEIKRIPGRGAGGRKEGLTAKISKREAVILIRFNSPETSATICLPIIQTSGMSNHKGTKHTKST
jgi:hypothetical protein